MKTCPVPLPFVLIAFHAANAINFLARTPKQCDQSSLLTHSRKNPSVPARNTQSSPSTAAQEFGETARPSVPSASHCLSKADDAWAHNCKCYPFQPPRKSGFPSVTLVSFLDPTEYVPLEVYIPAFGTSCLFVQRRTMLYSPMHHEWVQKQHGLGKESALQSHCKGF